MLNFDDGLKALDGLIASLSTSTGRTWNEATTRLKIIDTLFFDCLGWRLPETTIERYHEGEYTDYEFGMPPALVVEAKREGETFTLPAGWSQATCRLEALAAADPAIAKVINQALEYALQRGIPYAVVCNGHELVAYIASRRDGVPPLKGRASVFRSLDDMRLRFRSLWDQVSPAGVAESTLSRLLDADVLPAPPDKLSASLREYPGFKNRNHLAAELQILGGLYLEDLPNDPEIEREFLEHTYCQSGALSKYALVSRELLKARYATAFERSGGVSATAAVDKKGITPELSQDVLAASLSRRPILLVGDVGCGKSSFIRHFIRIDAGDILKNAIVLYLDFGSRPALVTELRPYVVEEIARQLRENYSLDVLERNFVRGVYHSELQRFERGIFADLKTSDPGSFLKKELEFLEGRTATEERHLEACLAHISRGQRRHIVLFLDNIDQRPPQFQEEVFLISQSLATNWPITAFVTLRPETFTMSRSHGSLSAYQPRVFTIAPPRVELVMKRRLSFAREQLRGHRLPVASNSVTIDSRNLHKMFDVLLDAFENGQEIIEFVENMAAGNVRRALDFVTTFVGSGHVDSQKIIDVVTTSGKYQLPLHEFQRAVLFGDHEHYYPADSQIPNVFDISTNDSREHFLVLAVLNFVESAGRAGGTEGYVDLEAIHLFCQSVGFHTSQVRAALRRCEERGLATSPVGLRVGDAARVRISTAGAYVAKRLARSFTYVDAVIVDTPIVDAAVRGRIRDEQGIDSRLDRALVFVEYLDSAWAALGWQGDSAFAWPQVASDLRREIDEIRERVRRRRSSGRPHGLSA